MAIVAQPIAGSNLPILLTYPVEDNQILVFDADHGVFVNKEMDVNVTGVITSARNLGGLNTFGIYKKTSNNGILEFYNITEGTGINLTLVGDSLMISTDLETPAVSVSDSYSIVIDNDGNNPNAVFDIQTVHNLSAITLPVRVLPPVLVSGLLTGNISGRGFIRSINNVDFSAAGYRPNMVLNLEGSFDQDGIYIVNQVENTTVSGNNISTIFFLNEFMASASMNMGGPKFPTTITQGSIWIPDNDGDLGLDYDSTKLYSIQVWGINTSSLRSNMLVRVSGTESGIIDGTYRISRIETSGHDPAIKWPGIIFDKDTPLPEGLVPGVVFDDNLINNKTELVIDSFIGTTGFNVDTTGVVQAKKVIVSSAPINNSDLTNKLYVDTAINNAVLSIEVSSLSDIENTVSSMGMDILDLKRKASKALRYYLLYSRN